MEPFEIANAEKKGLDYFLDGDDYMAYTQPVQSAEDFVARGLLTETGEATDKGALFLQLRDRGYFQPDGKYTERGYAYAMPVPETYKRENKWAFKIREKDGVGDTDTSFRDLVGGVGEYLWDAGAGLMTLAAADQARTKEESLAPLIGATEGMLKSTEELGGLAGVGTALLTEQFGQLIGMDQAGEDIVWDAKQDAARIRYENQTAKAGSVVDGYADLANATETMAQAKSTMTPEAYNAMVKQTAATGSLVDPTLFLPAGAAAKAGKVGVITRMGIKADATLAKVALMDAEIAAKNLSLASAERSATTAQKASELASKLGDTITARFEASGDQVLAQRARTAQEISVRTAAESTKSAEEVSRLTPEIQQLAAVRNSLATRIPESMAGVVNRAIEVGTAARSAPLVVMGNLSEKVGNSLIALDSTLSNVAATSGTKAAYNLVRGAVGTAGYTVGSIPGAAVGVGAMNVLQKSGPILESSGKFARIVGQELTKARGQVPFWQRVANYSELSPVHRFTSHLLDTATLGGAVPGAIRKTATGFSAAYPIDLFFEYLADGGDPNADTFKRAAAQSLVIGGSSAMLGGAFQGTKARHRELALGDEINFRSDITDSKQKAIFDGMKAGTRRSIATYAASNPQLKFNFTESGPSSFDRTSNTATINVRDTKAIQPLIAHEVMHHVVIRNQMEDGISAMLIGDGESGGLLRSNDGTLDQNFQNFHAAYNSIHGEGIPLKEAALEYYIDAASTHMADIAESGELGAISGRSGVGRLMQTILDATLPSVPVIKDLHMKMGGLIDGDGVNVAGVGLLSEGIRELPQSRALTRKMLKNSAGRAEGRFSPLGSSSNDTAGAIPVQKGDKALIDKMVSIFETEEVNGQTRVKYDKDGDPIPLSQAKDAARANISLVVTAALQKRKESGVASKPNEITSDSNGGFSGTYLGDDVIKAIKERGILNQEQLRILKNINSAVKNFDGHRFTVINHPATKKVGKKVKYATLSPTLRDVAPVAIIPTKSGNMLVGLMSVTQLEANIQSRIATKRGKRLYAGDMERLRNDISEVMQRHRRDESTESYFIEKYGATRGIEYKNFVNTVFGLMTPSQKTGTIVDGVRKEPNPLFEADKVGYKDNVYKTYRIDRISQATKMTGDFIPMPFVYNSVKLNLMPNGVPTLDQQGNPVSGRDTKKN